MPTIERFEEIYACQTARALTRQVYEVSARGPFAHDYGLRDQMRRAAVSIMSSVAEGFESGTRPLFIRYLRNAKGSAGELRPTLRRPRCGLSRQRRIRRASRGSGKMQPPTSRFITYLESHPGRRAVKEPGAHYDMEEDARPF